MKAPRSVRSVLLAGILALPAAAAAAVAGDEAERRGREIMSAVDDRASGFGDVTSRVTMILRNGKGKERERVLEVKELEVAGDGDKQLIVFRKPADIQGTALLTHAHVLADDDQWLLLPAFRRVKRISSANQSGPFVASEFAYEDVVAPDSDDYVNRYLGEDEVNELDCHVIEQTPRFAGSGYRRQIVYVDKDELRYQKIVYYDRNDELLKTLELGDYRLYLEQFWTPHTMHMTNHQSGKSTLMLRDDAHYRSGLTANDFTVNALKQVR